MNYFHFYKEYIISANDNAVVKNENKFEIEISG